MCPESRDKVNSSLSNSIDTISDLERGFQNRGLGRDEARQRIADGLRIGIGTLERLIRNRVKRIDADLRDRIQELHIQELQKELGRITHELEVARLTASRTNASEILEAKTYLQKARALLDKMVGSQG